MPSAEDRKISKIALVLKMLTIQFWLVRLSGLSASLRTKGSLVQFLVRAHAWVAGQIPGKGARGR